ncbi:MAG: hypothetical protein Q9216_002018 [Gyalolechia sp. 2 TL-2023]
MPTEGTAKHFYCAKVLEFDKPAVLYQKPDCTGEACFLPGEGTYLAWAHGAQANCILIDPQPSVTVPPCLLPGQNTLYPSNGGFPSGVPENVGGEYGVPAAYADSRVCSPRDEGILPPPIQRDPYDPPAGDLSQQYQSGLTATGPVDSSELDSRSTRSRLLARVDSIRPITSTTYLRNAYPYRAAFLAGVQQVWWFIAAGGVLQSRQLQLQDGDPQLQTFSVDHVVELNMIINFVSQAYDVSMGITENQWNTVQDFIRYNGQRDRAAPNGDLWCQVYDQFAAYAGGFGNLRGVARRINDLKNSALSAVLPGVPAPDWTTICTVEEARALSEFFKQTRQQAQLAAAGIGAAMDVIAGSTPTQAFSKAFAKWVVGIWTNAYFQMQMAAARPGG